MGKVTQWIKYVFIFFNTLFAIVGCVLLGYAVKFTVDAQQFPELGSAVLWYWLFSFTVLSLSVLGVYGAWTEKMIPLIVFAVIMGIAAVVLLSLGITTVMQMAQVRRLLQENPSWPRLSENSELSETLESAFQISLAIYFGVGAVAVLGVLISSLMVHQIRRHDSASNQSVPMKFSA